ncbi:RDD family protein [Vibrio parahaemolyticus]|uniref:RDD family protein n=1 Tax=Vibrio parahaemolyticus TaxID=670 RepID=UPI00226A96EC|nr:RDD family protein [Vibrio parahaemolyticus]MCX8905731.1 RDD family protein [Vibrio parahaemolyticus]
MLWQRCSQLNWALAILIKTWSFIEVRIEPKFSDIDLDVCESSEIIECTKYVSPEQSRLNKPLASPGRRYCGQFLDLIISWLLLLLLMFLLNEMGSSREQTDFISISVSAIYLIFSDALPRGQSVGKLMLGMSVIDKESGEYCSLWQSFIRNILNPLIGLIDAIFILSRKRQRIGDLAANTIVVKNS